MDNQKGSNSILANLADLLSLALGITVFNVLLVVDAWRAFRKRAHRIPGNCLILNALTIQLLDLLNAPNVNISGNSTKEEEERQYLIQNLLPISTRRLVMCVFIGYLLPGMAHPDSKGKLSDIAALVVSLSLNITSELYFILNKNFNLLYFSTLLENSTSNNEIWFVLSSVTTLVSVIQLILLLGCAALASKSIQNIVATNIRRVLSTDSNADQELSWEMVEEQTMKSWLVVHAYKPEYIIARSVLISSAGLVVTICILISVPVYKGYSSLAYGDELDWLRYTTFGLQFIFVIIGWSIICRRWFTAVAYYPKLKKNCSIRKYFSVEYFWIKSIVEVEDLIEIYKAASLEQEVSEGSYLRDNFRISVTVKLRLHKLLPALRWLQICVVLLSKACWLLSEKFLHPCKYVIEDKTSNGLSNSFSKYKNAFNELSIPVGEDAETLWMANWESLRQTDQHRDKGFDKRRQKCGHLVTLIRKCASPSRQSVAQSCLNPTLNDEIIDPQMPQAGRELEYVVGESSWKMTAVSLINIMNRLSALDRHEFPTDNPDPVKNAIKASSQAWEAIN